MCVFFVYRLGCLIIIYVIFFRLQERHQPYGDVALDLRRWNATLQLNKSATDSLPGFISTSILAMLSSQREGARKQFPLAFALMSRKTKEDYIAVLRCLKEKLTDPVVEAFVLDFEKGNLFFSTII